MLGQELAASYKQALVLDHHMATWTSRRNIGMAELAALTER